MKRNSILYVCSNDGSDMRVTKEIASLSKKYDVDFLGVGFNDKNSYVKEYCRRFICINGDRKSILMVLKFYYNIFLCRCSAKYSSIYVVDEQFYAPLMPVFFFSNLVLDIFDSFFLKMNKKNNEWSIMKRIIYSMPKKIIVTDWDRKKLMPDFVQDKIFVLQNFPFIMNIPEEKKMPATKVVIGLFGTLHKDRGVSFCNKLLDVCDNIFIECGGWLGDEASKNFILRKDVHYNGILPQQDIFKIIKNKVDYILMIYPTNNINNIYASPNKMYDAIHCGVPVIVNGEINIQSTVVDLNIGIVFSSKSLEDQDGLKILVDQIFEKKSTFKNVPWSALARKYSWDAQEKDYFDMMNEVSK